MPANSERPTPLTAYRGMLLHFLSDPGEGNDPRAAQFFDDGVLVVENGRVKSVGAGTSVLAGLPDTARVIDCAGQLILPGFIDTHIHYPQTDMIASYGRQLLDWLERYTYPAEAAFVNAEHAREVAEFFLAELLRNGTTTAMVFATVHAPSVDAFFRSAATRNLRMIAGKVLMDRNCPEHLRDTPEQGYRESSMLIEKWLNQGRLGYAITPRFAVTSSDAQLELAGQLARENPDAHIQSHMAEIRAELPRVRELFPASRDYVDVFERFGLMRERAVYAHCIYLSPDERARMAQLGAAAAVCPTSNLFLGSGLFEFEAARAAGMQVGIGTDVGAGTSFNMLRTLSEAYKVAEMTGHPLSPWRAFYLATLGGARALGLDQRIGNFEAGKEADFLVLRLDATPLLARRMRTCVTPADKLFALMMLGDDRTVAATYVMGAAAYRASPSEKG